jgi:hypothetical protein
MAFELQDSLGDDRAPPDRDTDHGSSEGANETNDEVH